MSRKKVYGLVTLVTALLTLLGLALLPSMVASHFNAAGIADGYAPRALFLAINAAIVAIPPLLVAGVGYAVARRPPAGLHIPHRAYWLAPGRRAATLAWISGWTNVLAIWVLLQFSAMAFTSILANHASPPHWPAWSAGLQIGLAALLLPWLWYMHRHFRTLPPPHAGADPST